MTAVRALTCPQCNGSLSPSKFARMIVCPYCGTTVQLADEAVSAAVYREAFTAWNSPAAVSGAPTVRIGGGWWALEGFIARGEIADVYAARRARWPTERAVVKFLRDKRDADLFDREWQAVALLRDAEVPGAETFSALIPQPIAHGDVAEGPHAGGRASVFRWTVGFRHTLEDVRQAYPKGIEPRPSIWIWRRILEILSFVHAARLVHGAVLPPQILIQENDHGVRLVGFSCAARIGKKLPAADTRFEAFYPAPVLEGSPVVPGSDLAMSARCIAAALGGDVASGVLPDSVPPPLAAVVRRVGWPDPKDPLHEDALVIREELGEVSRKVFGAPKFCPIAMPK